MNEQSNQTDESIESNLPRWAKGMIAMPTALLRSEVFSAISREKYSRRDFTPLSSSGDVEISVKGEQLCQSDARLFEYLLDQVSKNDALFMRASAREMLISLGRNDGGLSHEKLHQDLDRLVGTRVCVVYKSTGNTYTSSLVASVSQMEPSKKFRIHLDQQLVSLFSESYVLIEKKLREKLGNKALAQWILGYYSTHKSPYPIQINTLRNLCGSLNFVDRSFKQKLKSALAILKDINEIDDFEIKDNLVHVTRTSSRAKVIQKIR